MIINVIAKGKINCRRFIRLSAIRLDVNQIKLPGYPVSHSIKEKYRIHSEEMEMMAALTEASNNPMQFGLRAVR